MLEKTKQLLSTLESDRAGNSFLIRTLETEPDTEQHTVGDSQGRYSALGQRYGGKAVRIAGSAEVVCAGFQAR